VPRRSSARLRELVAGASAFLAVGFEQPELGQGFEVAAGGVVGAPGEVGVFAGSHVAHETLQEAGERLALARVDLRGGRLAPEPGPPEDAFHHEVRGVARFVSQRKITLFRSQNLRPQRRHKRPTINNHSSHASPTL